MCECDEEISSGGDEMSFWVRRRKQGAVHRFITEVGRDEGKAMRGAMRSGKARSAVGEDPLPWREERARRGCEAGER
jgi:hypothetical protein